jgi:hypothetical protein
LARHEGEFIGDGNGIEYNYSVEKWKELDGPYREEIDESDLSKVEHMTIQIEDQDSGEIGYQNIVGPMESWEFVEDILGYDWGEEGSRGRA